MSNNCSGIIIMLALFALLGRLKDRDTGNFGRKKKNENTYVPNFVHIGLAIASNECWEK